MIPPGGHPAGREHRPPEITFTFAAVEQTGAEDYRVIGDLTIKSGLG